MAGVWGDTWRIASALGAIGVATLLWAWLLPRLSVPVHEEVRPEDVHELPVLIDPRFEGLERVMVRLASVCSVMIFLFASLLIYIVARWGMGYAV